MRAKRGVEQGKKGDGCAKAVLREGCRGRNRAARLEGRGYGVCKTSAIKIGGRKAETCMSVAVRFKRVCARNVSGAIEGMGNQSHGDVEGGGEEGAGSAVDMWPESEQGES